jgi:TonB family protein
MRVFELRASVASFVVHAAVLLLLTLKAPWKDSILEFEPKSSLETRTLSEEDFRKLSQNPARNSEQIVQSENLKSNQDLQAPLSQKIFKSEATNVVDQNTRAARNGEFKNVLKEGLRESSNRAPASASASDSEEAPKSEVSPLMKNLFTLPTPAPEKAGGPDRKTASLPPAGASGEGFSATNDYLPDVAIGANTLLNTHEFKYYSFYERIRQKLSFQWESRLKNEFNKLVQQGVQQITGDRITKLRVHIKKDGSIVRTDLMGTSGYHELDRAALEAFRAASPFPNPPSGLMSTQEELSIDWSFVVVTAEDNGVRLSVRRNPQQ